MGNYQKSGVNAVRAMRGTAILAFLATRMYDDLEQQKDQYLADRGRSFAVRTIADVLHTVHNAGEGPAVRDVLNEALALFEVEATQDLGKEALDQEPISGEMARDIIQFQTGVTLPPGVEVIIAESKDEALQKLQKAEASSKADNGYRGGLYL